ncbi:MAG: hypothetical protein LBF33_00745 [Oscillospiraceae bacterium]|nr:hypothetical protein [Oscillospiraceae bacterium]
MIKKIKKTSQQNLNEENEFEKISAGVQTDITKPPEFLNAFESLGNIAGATDVWGKDWITILKDDKWVWKPAADIVTTEDNKEYPEEIWGWLKQQELGEKKEEQK